MTIAGMYFSPEGVVLGADSTSSVNGENGYHYFNYGQKLFEIGQDSTFGILTWGMGSVGTTSYRTLVANLGDDLAGKPATSVGDVAARWIDIFWPQFLADPSVQQVLDLHKKAAHDPADAASKNNRSADEEALYARLSRELGVGFCIAGHAVHDRQPAAVTVLFRALEPKPSAQSLNPHAVNWWGMPNVMNRLVFGVDDDTVAAVMASKKWGGTDQELVDVLTARPWLPRAHLPIRDAIDYVHSAIYCTIKAMKFSNLPQVCGGPIELAVITSDRKFRWVRHKAWDAAIADGEMK